MQRTDAGVVGFQVHQIVKAVDQRPHSGFSAQRIECRGIVTHKERLVRTGARSTPRSPSQPASTVRNAVAAMAMGITCQRG